MGDCSIGDAIFASSRSMRGVEGTSELFHYGRDDLEGRDEGDAAGRARWEHLLWRQRMKLQTHRAAPCLCSRPCMALLDLRLASPTPAPMHAQPCPAALSMHSRLQLQQQLLDEGGAEHAVSAKTPDASSAISESVILLVEQTLGRPFAELVIHSPNDPR